MKWKHDIIRSARVSGYISHDVFCTYMRNYAKVLDLYYINWIKKKSILEKIMDKLGTFLGL